MGDWFKRAVVYQVYPKSFMDANGDGIVDVSDILRIKSCNLGTASLDAVQLFAADASGDDMADVADILRIKAHILGKTTLEW